METPQILKLQPNPNIPEFGPGDTVRVNFRIREGDRVRVQAFQGVVISRQNGSGPSANFCVRRIAGGGIGVEKIFPLYSPLIDSLEVTRRGSVRRAKLYYLRGLQGRAARIKERTRPRNTRPEETMVVVEPEPVVEPVEEIIVDDAAVDEVEAEAAVAEVEAAEAEEVAVEAVEEEAPVAEVEDAPEATAEEESVAEAPAEEASAEESGESSGEETSEEGEAENPEANR
jgi:large subunit ribosomal protein L19